MIQMFQLFRRVDDLFSLGTHVKHRRRTPAAGGRFSGATTKNSYDDRRTHNVLQPLPSDLFCLMLPLRNQRKRSRK
ncbi:hypothetical protein EYF80_030657 [Liparis tanakae]|uniref:Uncharacterized protein n=1 Tax=Liparis tanakae TaxID=230148 RepID=A0A4Z2H208_9TELE|nr:hypothetical protein EYF80_030657 [Liparis tanakae]